MKDNASFRFDAEYFKKESLSKMQLIEKKTFKYIDDFSFVTDGIHESIQFDEDSNVYLISAKAPKENIFDLSRLERISVKHHLKNPRTALQENDVIVSTVGTIGNVAVVTNEILPANSDRHVGIIRCNDEVSPYFLSTFLLSKYGRFQTLRESTGNVQLNLFIYKIKTLKIPNLSNDFQMQIEALVKQAHSDLQASKQAYAEAEAVLLDELGLADFIPSTDAVSIKTFSDSFGSTGRLDAEYYQPKYDDLLGRIHSFEWGYQKLKTKGFFQNGSLISDEFYTNVGERAYLRIKELSLNLPIQDDKVVFIDNKFVMNNETIVKTNDFIIATIGNTIGKVNLIHEKYNGSFISNNTSKFSLYSNEEAFYYWEVLLRSLIVQEQIQREFTQTAQPKISNSSLEEIIVPIIQKETQQKISKLAERSMILKAQSEALLAIAKRGVELAIESNEASAQAWMLEQSGGLLASHDT